MCQTRALAAPGVLRGESKEPQWIRRPNPPALKGEEPCESYFWQAFIGILTGCLQTLAQSNASYGEIKGTVTDASGGLVSGGTVTVTNSNRGFSRTAITDERGEYRILLLPPAATKSEWS